MPPSRHLVRRAAEAAYVPAGGGLSRWPLVGEDDPAAVHTGFGICRLAPGGEVPAAVASYEQCVYLLEGSAVLQGADGALRLRPGDYALVPVGVPHAWRNDAEVTAVWADMLAPQPRRRCADDRVAVPAPAVTAAVDVDARDPRTRRAGHIGAGAMDVTRQGQDQVAVSASMRTALLVYSGITVKMMVDTDLGAQLTSMFMVSYDPDGAAGAHDHPFEETYLFLEGQAEARFDAKTYRLGPGDAAFAGVGCVHGFRNLGDGPLRWLETQAPQPPARHSYRFARDWEYLRDIVERGG